MENLVERTLSIIISAITGVNFCSTLYAYSRIVAEKKIHNNWKENIKAGYFRHFSHHASGKLLSEHKHRCEEREREREGKCFELVFLLLFSLDKSVRSIYISFGRGVSPEKVFIFAVDCSA